MITMSQIAELTGVSQPTVSRVLNGNTSVNEQTARKVLECAKKYNYQPNIIAQSLTGNKMHLIAVIVTDLSNPFFAEIVKSIEQEASKLGYNIMLFNSDYNIQKEEKYLKILQQYKVDGIILVPTFCTEEYVKKIKKYELPLVSLTREMKAVDSVFISHFEAGEKVAAHLLNIGFERFVFVGGEGDEKELGYQNQLKKANIDLKKNYLHITSSNDEMYLNELVNQLKTNSFASGTGIFTFNDVEAIKILEVLKKAAIEIPKDVAVVGFDNTIFGKIVTPSLTSVSQPIHEMGKLAVERLIEKIDSPSMEDGYRHYQLEARIVTRESSVSVKINEFEKEK